MQVDNVLKYLFRSGQLALSNQRARGFPKNLAAVNASRSILRDRKDVAGMVEFLRS